METQHKCCLGTKHHFHCDKSMKIRSVESEFHFLLNGMVTTRFHMVPNMLYIEKTDVKHCFVMKHHFRAPKSIKMVPSESKKHFLLKETIKTRSHMIKMMVYIGFYRKLSKISMFLEFFDVFLIFIKKKMFWVIPA